MPPQTALSDLGDIAQNGGTPESFASGDPDLGTVYVGPNGISITLGNYPDEDVKTYLLFKDTSTEQRVLEVRQEYVGGGHNPVVYNRSFTLPWECVVHVEGSIDGIEGEINSRVTVVSETGYVNISDDIVYVDDNHNPVYLYDKHNPESEDNFTLNPDYMEGDTKEPRVLAIAAKGDIFLTNQDGDATNDHDLLISAVLAAGVGGGDNDGAVRWLDYGQEMEGVSYADAQRDLRLLGSMISDGAPNGWAHWKGWSLGGGGHGGYNNSVFHYDDNLRNYGAPHFLQVDIPMYTGMEIIR